MADERLFQFVFGVFVFKPKKFEHIGVSDFLLGKDTVFGQRLFSLAQHGGLIAGGRSPFVKLGVDLPIKLPYRPAAAQGFGFVKTPGIIIFYRKQADISRPGQLETAPNIDKNQFCGRCLQNSRQCLANRSVRFGR